jgi:ComEC/Rec2-related protein
LPAPRCSLPLPFSPPWFFALGLAASFYPGLPWREIFLPAAAVACGLGIVLSFHRDRTGPGGGRDGEGEGFRLFGILALACGLGLGFGVAVATDEAGLPAGLGSDPTVLRGRLVADSTRARGGFTLYNLEVEELSLAGPGFSGRVSTRARIRLLVRGGPALEAGSCLEARSPRFPGEPMAGEGGPQAGTRRSEASGGSVGPAPGPGRAMLAFANPVAITARPPTGFPARIRSILRAAFHTALDRAGGGGATSGLLIALLEGSRDELDAAEGEAFKRAGCAAVLSLSGQHLSILAAALSLLLKPLGGPRKATEASLAIVFVFVFIAGWQPALLRSLVMYALAALALLCDRPQDTRTILGLSFALQLFLDPAAARELSFCLSYLALAGLVLLSPRFEHLLLPILPPAIAKATAASCAAWTATMPLAAASFGAAYPVGLVATVVSAPLVAAFLWWGLAGSLACGLAPAAAGLVAPVSGLIHAALFRTMDFFAAAPPLALSGRAASLASAGVVLAAAFVYALPHAEHAYRLATRLRRPHRAQGLPRGRGPRHVQALRPEFPREPERP